jgi:hypothetical protein
VNEIMPPKQEVNPSVNGYDYFDFGCSKGANITHTNSAIPGLRGLGIDIDSAKVEAAKGNGHEAIVFDILKLPERKLVDFVTMAHFLEHLPGVASARAMVAKAIGVSRNFVLIRQPWFDSDGELLRHDLKFYWSHWRGHRNKMTTLDFYSILDDELAKDRISGFTIMGRNPVKHSKHSSLLPLSAPMDQHQYDQSLHGEKLNQPLQFLAFKEVVVRIDVGSLNTMEPLLDKLAPLHHIYSSSGGNV